MSSLAPARLLRTLTIKRITPDSPEDTLTFLVVLACAGTPIWVAFFVIGTYFC